MRNANLIGAALLGALACALPVRAQTFHVDCTSWSGPPLVKTKFGVYQTPLIDQATLLRSTTLLREAGVQDLRYEMGWGKPGTLAFDQIAGAADRPTIDFSRLDPFLRRLTLSDVRPLLALTYDPTPLQTGAGWQRWKDVPGRTDAWREICRRYAAHYRAALGLRGPLYEIWNEPDLPGDGGKVFFNGGPAEYGTVYANGALGVRRGDADADVGGAAIAYDTRYIAPVLDGPIDFVSAHAYDDFSVRLANVRRQIGDRPGLPILLTEYASFKEFGLQAPVSRHPAAERFFRDVRGLLEETDAPKVYWAQWVDDDLGLLTHDLHRKALFNALTLYQTRLPVDRNPVVPDRAAGVGTLAGSDDHRAAVAIWNENTTDTTVTVHLERLPFRRGVLTLSRIDGTHASFLDHAAAALTVDGRWPIDGPAASWTGTVPAESVVFLQADDGTGQSLLRERRIGVAGRRFYWFSHRASGAYADFDARTSIARVGAGRGDGAVALIGTIFDRPARRLSVEVRRSGPFRPGDVNALFGLRIDYGSEGGGWSKSALWHDGSYRTARTAVFPWGRGKATVDEAHAVAGMRTGAPFVVDIARAAPNDWNGRVLLTPILQNRGAGSQARICLSPHP